MVESRVQKLSTGWIGRIMLGAGVLATLVFFILNCKILFWFSMGIVAAAYFTSWLLCCCARHGFTKRVIDLKEKLLYSRTLEKKLQGDTSISPIEEDDVDVLIAKIFRGTLDEIPSWAICDIRQVNELKGLYQKYPDRLDPNAQPTWLCLIGTILLIGCPILLVIALIMSM